MPELIVLDEQSLVFPNPEAALIEPNGLLAVGGDLTSKRLINAYKSGIFPWYEKDQPILWWSPNPRSVFALEWMHVSRSLKKTLKQQHFHITYNENFNQVIQACREPRAYSDGTWITDQMINAYIKLHQLGHAHSVEVWKDDKLVGGLYGIAMGRIFFGESMFNVYANASKVAFFYLVTKLQSLGFQLIDCQVHSAHMASLGAREIPRIQFLAKLNNLIDNPLQSNWR